MLFCFSSHNSIWGLYNKQTVFSPLVFIGWKHILLHFERRNSNQRFSCKWADKSVFDISWEGNSFIVCSLWWLTQTFCQSKEEDKAKLEIVLVTIEYEALIQAVVQILAMNLRDADSKVATDIEYIITLILLCWNTLTQMIEDFIGYQLKEYTNFLELLLNQPERNNTLMMHMLEQTKCLQLFRKNYSRVCSTFKISSDSKVCWSNLS